MCVCTGVFGKMCFGSSGKFERNFSEDELGHDS